MSCHCGAGSCALTGNRIYNNDYITPNWRLSTTMASEASQPCAEGVSLSGAIARQGGRLHHSRCTGVTSTTQRRVARSAIVCGQIGMSGGLAVLTTYYLWR